MPERAIDHTIISLSTRTARGMAWLLCQTALSKFLSTGGQIALGWLLLEEDFGLAALALTVTAFISLLRDAGLQQILVQRQRHLYRWITPAFWMSLSLGVCAAFLTILAAPMVARLYRSSTLVGLLMVLALANPIYALGTVPHALLQVQLRFRALAQIAFSQVLASVLVAVTLAWLGFGPYSLVWANVAAALVRSSLGWLAEPPAVRLHPRFRRWRFLVEDSTLLFGASLSILITLQADYLILGWFQPAAVVGTYFFAYNLSTQTLQLLTTNLAAVLFPALSKLPSEAQRQVEAFLRASELLAYIGVPFCLLQAFLAGPVLRLLFGAKWLDAIPVLELLSVGMAVLLIGAQWPSLAQSQGRYRLFFWITLSCAVLFLVLVGIGARFGGAIGAAWAVLLTNSTAGPISLIIAVRVNGLPLSRILPLYAGPLLLGSGATCASYLAARAVASNTGGGDWTILILTLLLVCAAYPAMLRLMTPRVWTDIIGRLRAVASGGSPLSRRIQT